MDVGVAQFALAPCISHSAGFRLPSHLTTTNLIRLLFSMRLQKTAFRILKQDEYCVYTTEDMGMCSVSTTQAESRSRSHCLMFPQTMTLAYRPRENSVTLTSLVLCVSGLRHYASHKRRQKDRDSIINVCTEKDWRESCQLLCARPTSNRALKSAPHRLVEINRTCRSMRMELPRRRCCPQAIRPFDNV